METSLETCEGLDPRLSFDAFKVLGAQVLYGYEDRKLLPVLVYRINRCSPADVGALNHFVSLLFTPDETPSPSSVLDLLGLNVALIDNFPDSPPPLEDVIASYEEKLVALGPRVRHRLAYDVWPATRRIDTPGNSPRPRSR